MCLSASDFDTLTLRIGDTSLNLFILHQTPSIHKGIDTPDSQNRYHYRYLPLITARHRRFSRGKPYSVANKYSRKSGVLFPSLGVGLSNQLHLGLVRTIAYNATKQNISSFPIYPLTPWNKRAYRPYVWNTTHLGSYKSVLEVWVML